MVIIVVLAGTYCVLTVLGGKGEGQRQIIAGVPWSAGS